MTFLEQSGDADYKKIIANFLFGGFFASYGSWCVNEHSCFVLKLSDNNPALRIAPKPYLQCSSTNSTLKIPSIETLNTI